MSLIFSTLAALVLGILTFKSYLVQNRGTNAVTRFVRENIGHSYQTQFMVISAVLGVLFTITSFAGENQWYSGIPCFIVTGVNVFLMIKSTKDKQRVKDARTTTKGTLKVIEQTGEVAGGVAATAAVAVATQGKATATAYKAAYKVGSVAGAGIGEITGKCADSMVDVDVPDFDMSKVTSMMSEEKFLELAQNIGIPTEGRAFEEIGQDVYKYVPDFYKERHNDEAIETVACKFLQGVS